MPTLMPFAQLLSHTPHTCHTFVISMGNYRNGPNGANGQPLGTNDPNDRPLGTNDPNGLPLGKSMLTAPWLKLITLTGAVSKRPDVYAKHPAPRIFNESNILWCSAVG